MITFYHQELCESLLPPRAMRELSFCGMCWKSRRRYWIGLDGPVRSVVSSICDEGNFRGFSPRILGDACWRFVIAGGRRIRVFAMGWRDVKMAVDIFGRVGLVVYIKSRQCPN